jgi:hypothetical protein
MFQHLVKNLPWRVETVVAAKGGPTSKGGTNTNDFEIRCSTGRFPHTFGHVVYVSTGCNVCVMTVLWPYYDMLWQDVSCYDILWHGYNVLWHWVSSKVLPPCSHMCVINDLPSFSGFLSPLSYPPSLFHIIFFHWNIRGWERTLCCSLQCSVAYDPIIIHYSNNTPRALANLHRTLSLCRLSRGGTEPWWEQHRDKASVAGHWLTISWATEG